MQYVWVKSEFKNQDKPTDDALNQYGQAGWKVVPGIEYHRGGEIFLLMEFGPVE